MNKRTEDLILQPLLVRLLSYAELLIPVWQRHYGWGEVGLEEKALGYYEQHLSNLDSFNLVGAISIYSTHRWDYKHDQDISVWVSDGQHRLVTVVIAAIAVVRRLKQIALDTSSLNAKEERLLERLLDESELLVAAASRMQVKYNEFGHSACASDFINNALLTFDAQAEKRAEIEQRYAEKHAAIHAESEGNVRKERKKANTLEKNAELKRLAKEVKGLEKIGVFHSFRRIEAYLAKISDASVIAEAKSFSDRIGGLKAVVICVQPYHDDEELQVVEHESFILFSALNGKSVPLTEGQLMASALMNLQPASTTLQAHLRDNTSEYAAARYFGLETQEHLCEYLSKMSTGDGELKTYSWVRSTLHSGDIKPADVRDIETSLAGLRQFHAKIQKLSSPWRSLYDMFFQDHARVGSAVFCTRCVLAIGIDKCDESYMKALLKLLVVFEICAIYNVIGRKKFNITRDIPRQTMTSLEDGILSAKLHFDAVTVEELQRKMAAFLSTAPIGQLPAQRKLAKFLMVLADVDNGGQDVQLPAWQAYEYEHIMPMNEDNLLLDEDMPASVRQNTEEYLAQTPLEKNITLHCLGNAALLNKKENIKLSNSSPHVKFQVQVKKLSYSNGWRPSHLRWLQDVQGNVSVAAIRARSLMLANQVCGFLLGAEYRAKSVALAPAVHIPAQMKLTLSQSQGNYDGWAGLDTLDLHAPATAVNLVGSRADEARMSR